MATTEEYAKFAAMLVSRGQWNGKRLLSPRTVDLMSSVFVPDTMPGREPGRGYGLSVQVVSDPVKAGFRVGAGTFGWDGAYGTHFWVDPKEKIAGVMMIQIDNSNRQVDRYIQEAEAEGRKLIEEPKRAPAPPPAPPPVAAPSL